MPDREALSYRQESEQAAGLGLGWARGGLRILALQVLDHWRHLTSYGFQ